MQALERAARDVDDGAFDTAFGDLLDRARSAANPEPALRARVAGRMQSELALPLELVPSALPRGSGVRLLPVPANSWLRPARGFALLAAGIAIGFVLGRTTPVGWPDERTAARDAREHAVSSTGSSEGANVAAALPPSVAVPAPSAALPIAGSAASTSASTSAASPAASPAAPPAPRSQSEHSSLPRERRRPLPDPDSLRFALEQLRKAQLFLRAHEPARALGALDTLDARVPISVLQEEREVTRTLAWCDSGQVAKARALARRLLQRAPDTAYAVSLRESCASADSHDTPDLLQQMRERTSNPPR
jgi:hypothetical protein